MEVKLQFLGGLGQRSPEGGANWVGQGQLGHHAVPEKGGDPAGGAVDELVDEYQMSRLDLFLQGANSRDGKDTLHAQALKTPNVGPIIDLARQNPVSLAVTGEKNDGNFGELPRYELVG